MAIKSTKKVLVSVLSFAVFSQPFCGAIKNFMENKVDPRKSIVIKKEKPTGFDKIKEFAKKHPVKAAVGGVVGLGTVIIVGGITVKNAFFDDKGVLTIKEGITTIGESLNPVTISSDCNYFEKNGFLYKKFPGGYVVTLNK